VQTKTHARQRRGGRVCPYLVPQLFLATLLLCATFNPLKEHDK
jgi:hypothetical protein